MKKFFAAALVLVMLAASVAGCGSQKERPQDSDESHHYLYFKDSSKSDLATATFFNSDSGDSEEIEMTAYSEDNDSRTFCCEGNTSLYNMAKISYGDDHTKEFAFNKCVSGWYESKDGFLPYTEGEPIKYQPEYDEVTLDCNGYEKKIHIWKPDDYDAASSEKYASVYVLDGQMMAYVGKAGQSVDDTAVVTEQVKAMTCVTGKKAIVIAVDTYGDMGDVSRDAELAPDLSEYGAQIDREMKGNEFADFVAHTLVPYVQENYNVYTDALHTAVAGASLGGLESFYITMEYPELFGTAGALSPSFLFYDNDEMWRKYLSEKSFDENVPFLYFYTGPEGGDTDPYVTDMVNRLKDLGYPPDKLALHYNENGGHIVWFWRSVFSEFLEAMMFRSVEPLQK